MIETVLNSNVLLYILYSTVLVGLYINCKFPSSDMSNYKFVSNGKKVYTGRKRVWNCCFSLAIHKHIYLTFNCKAWLKTRFGVWTLLPDSTFYFIKLNRNNRKRYYFIVEFYLKKLLKFLFTNDWEALVGPALTTA